MTLYSTDPTAVYTCECHLIEIAKEKRKDYSITQFHGTGKIYSLICRRGEIVIPKQIQISLIEWYHDILCYPGKTKTNLKKMRTLGEKLSYLPCFH